MDNKSTPFCKVLKGEFLYSVPKISLMKSLGGEIAFIGRSNAGKSSLINALAKIKDLARTAKMPGRTRHAVVYQLVFSDKDLKKPVLLVDLPGFGFATMSKTEAEECEALIFSYLHSRKELNLIVLLLDIRRSLDEREMKIIHIAKVRGIEIILVLTKSDKIVMSTRKPAKHKVLSNALLDDDHVFLHSTHDDASTNQLRNFIFDRLDTP